MDFPLMATAACAVAYLAALVSVAMCDYQLEVNFISYNNSARSLQNGRCCDSINTRTVCSVQDTCDVQFMFSVENINTVTTFSDQNKIVGTYENRDVIRFDNCSAFTNGVRNPLTFIIPSNQWRSGNILRVLTEIVDVDQNIISSSTETIMSTRPIVLIEQPSTPLSAYTHSQPFYGPNSLSLTFEYRVICSAGTCGSDCSQTTNCLPFPSCVPLTCADSPCQNGGTCTLIQGSSFSCSCREGFTGPTCGVIIPSSSTTVNIYTDTATTQNVVMSTSSSQDTRPKDVQSCPVTVVVASSIVVFIFTAVVFLAIGIFIGYLAHKRKFTANSLSSLDKSTHTTPHAGDQPSVSAAAPEYAPIHVTKGAVEEHVQGFGMKKNTAYALSALNTVATGGQSEPKEHGYNPVQVSNNYVSSYK